jgi:aryl-alcohol dehydrogenase-like predicted oxidoreductase
MRTVPLGPSDTISEIMLGTMTYGNQTDRADAHAQMSMAANAGVTWLDTAEMYPVLPVRAETVGLSEEIVGEWLADHPNAMRVATKISGAGSAARGGEAIGPDSIRRAVEASLKRLKVEAIDLYQFHWPNRGSFQFRQNWTFRPGGDRDAVIADMEACVAALEAEVARGTIRAFGLSNEGAWGMDQWLRLAGPATRPVSIQNEYSLTYRLQDCDLAETLAYDRVTMLAFSPLAAGLLTGKYRGGAVPEGSRRSLEPAMGGRWTERAQAALEAYVALAGRHGIDPVHMALAWLQTRPFACAAILGATTAAQLEHGLGAAGLELSEELVTEIDEVHRVHPMPY